jgi:hypothetical protein
MKILSYPLRYLALQSDAGNRLYRRDSVFLFGMATILALPFIFFDGNFFGASGLLDRVGTFASVLTGFYIAALVGVASLSSTVGDLDDIIDVGPIFGPDVESGQLEKLTRRQYVCSLFGYLAFVSLFISISAIFAVVCSGIITPGLITKAQASIVTWTGFSASCVATSFEFIRGGIIIVYAVVISHIVATTCHGLYYYIDRIYLKRTTIGTKTEDGSDSPPSSS